MEYRVFISYATADLKLADYLAESIRLRVPTADVFIAEYRVPCGRDLAFDIYTALINADVVVLLWTPVSQLSNWVKTEGEYAFVLGKYLTQIMTVRGITISKPLRTLKYDSVHRHRSVRTGLLHVANEIAEHARRILFSRRLIADAERSLCSLSRDDDAFYNFALRALRKNNSDVLFISGSPRMVLPFEATSHARQEYLQLMRSRFVRRGETGIARYVFNKKRAFNRLRSATGEANALPAHLRFIRPLLESSSFSLMSSEHLDFVPSGLVTPTKGALVLKDPSDPERTVGVYFVKGKQLAAVIRAFRELSRPDCVEPQDVWIPEVMHICYRGDEHELSYGTRLR